MFALGLMSGTWGWVDASILSTNGINQSEIIRDKYFEYDSDIFRYSQFKRENS